MTKIELDPFHCKSCYLTLKPIVEFHEIMAIRHPVLYGEGSPMRATLTAYKECLRMLEGRPMEEEEKSA